MITLLFYSIDVVGHEFYFNVVGKIDGQIVVEQKNTASWSAKGRTYYRYSTVLTNKSGKTVKDLKVSIEKLYGPLWGLSKSEEGYGFPSWMNSLPVGKSLEFVYIHSASPAEVKVADYTLE